MKGRPLFPLIYLMLCALAAVTSRAELALTNYTSAHPLKVLEIGDSITDDSVTNGAWRVYLEPLLLTNGYAFTNLGRWTSIVQAGFTRVHHEGMDGSVIAYPGVSGTTHGYAAISNYSLLTVADAFATMTNALPDLVLIDMGVNDMGRGRDPQYVATNDLSALLDLIFSNVPSAHIIVSKPTTISYATILNYSAYGTNMPIFCGAVQALAAARRARGQNVYVADLFSVVNGQTMVNTSDDLHPNSVGRLAIANEMMFRIAAITARPDFVTTPFIFSGSVWKYSDQGLNLGTNWSQPGYDDSAWSQGAGRLGYNVPGLTTTVSYGTNSSSKYITTYFRNAFIVSPGVAYTNLSVRLNGLDGAVVWLNGRELYRYNMNAGTVTYQTTAKAFIPETKDAPNTYLPTNLPIAALPTGTNVIAVEIHKYSAGAAGLAFDLELFGKGYTPPPTLSVTSTSGTLQLLWPTNYATYSLQTTTNLRATNTWQTIPGPYASSNGFFEVPVSNNAASSQFFRLKPGS